MTKAYNELARWITTRRQKMGISIREMGRQSGVSYSVIADAEKGMGLSVNACKKLAKYFSKVLQTVVTPEELMRMAGHLEQFHDVKGSLVNILVEKAMPLDQEDIEELIYIADHKAAKKAEHKQHQEDSGAVRDTQRRKELAKT